jgi:hypothetical protein
MNLMPRAYPVVLHPAVLALLVLTLWGLALPAHAQTKHDPYSIIVPEPGSPAAKSEPWLAPKYKSPRGSRAQSGVPQPKPPKTATPKAPTPPKVPPPIVVPQTGRVLPNLPTTRSPSGPHGTESFQDRAARCAHQAGVYGPAAGNPSAYINNCINQ